jgi:hypothetical protein
MRAWVVAVMEIAVVVTDTRLCATIDVILDELSCSFQRSLDESAQQDMSSLYTRDGDGSSTAHFCLFT